MKPNSNFTFQGQIRIRVVCGSISVLGYQIDSTHGIVKLVSDSRKSIALSLQNTSEPDLKIDPQFMENEGEAVVQVLNFIESKRKDETIDPVFKSVRTLEITEKPTFSFNESAKSASK